MRVPFDVLVPHQATGEDVHVTGDLQVKTVIKTRKKATKIKTTYKLTDDVVAVGVTSNQLYTIDGHDAVKYSVRDTTISQIFQVAVFTLHPPDADSPADRAENVEVQYQLTSDEDGAARAAGVPFKVGIGRVGDFQESTQPFGDAPAVVSAPHYRSRRATLSARKATVPHGVLS